MPHAHRENHTARSQTVDAQVCINKMDEKRHQSTHDASNHTMNTTGTCNPQKLRWHAFTWKPSTTGEHPTPTKQAMCHNSSDAAQKTRTRKHIWSTSPHIKSNFLCLEKHIFVTNEIRPLPKTRRTRNMRHMRQTNNNGNTSPKTSIHHCTRAPQQDVSELVLHVQVGHARHSERHKELKQTTRTMLAGTTHKASRHLIGSNNWSPSTQHGLPCDFLHDLGRCQRTCVLCSNAPHG